VLQFIAILISENVFLWQVAPASIIFVTCAVYGAIFLFQSSKSLLHHSLLVGLITAIVSLLYDIASKDILKLQCLQNCLVKRSPRFSNSIPLLKFLHWLPVQSGIIFELLPIKLFLLEKLHIYFPCFIYHPSLERSVHLVFICSLFSRLKLVCFSVAVPYSLEFTLWTC